MAGTFGDRLREARERREVSGPALAKQLGVSSQTFSEWERNKYFPSSDRLPIIAGLLSVSIDWLLTGRQASDGFEGIAKPAGRLVPKMTEDDFAATNGAARQHANEFVLAHYPCSKSAFQWTITDRSNAPAFELGDSVIVDPEIPPAPGDMVLLQINGKPVFRKWKPRGKKLFLEPLNQDWDTDTVSLGPYVLLRGTMTEHTKPRRS